jgi:hypothetical protein
MTKVIAFATGTAIESSIVPNAYVNATEPSWFATNGATNAARVIEA